MAGVHFDWDRARVQKSGPLFTAIDAHAGGEPLRIVTGGVPDIPGATMLERRQYLKEHLDFIRRALMCEPRGHYNMYGCILTPPVTPAAHFGVLFMHNEGYSTMCGHGIIALTTALAETGTVESSSDEVSVTFDTPAGLVSATAHRNEDGRFSRTSFVNVPSFVYASDVEIVVPGTGHIRIDIAFGGAFYAILPSRSIGLRVSAEFAMELARTGELVKEAVNEQMEIEHPTEKELGFLYGTIFTDAPEDPGHHSRNLCIFANREIDRSPTGTGVSARLAQLRARGELAEDECIVVESILGAASTFSGRVVGKTQVGRYRAIVPEISGSGFITGRQEFCLDSSDPLGAGFLIRG